MQYSHKLGLNMTNISNISLLLGIICFETIINIFNVKSTVDHYWYFNGSIFDESIITLIGKCNQYSFGIKHARKYYYMTFHAELSDAGHSKLKNRNYAFFFFYGIPNHALENM